MEARGNFDEFVPSGLASLGIEADQVELAVMRSVHDLYWPGIAAMMNLDLVEVEPEAGIDLSKPPGPA
jgi:hypothetical protein